MRTAEPEEGPVVVEVAMANKTNEENWAARERLRVVEMMLWWRGWAGRSDLMEGFGLSAAQASSDFQKYLELNGKEVSYQTSRKRYEAGEDFVCLLHEPVLEEAVGLLGNPSPAELRMECIGPRAVSSERLALLHLPMRRATKEVERRVFMALANGHGLRVKYTSVNSDQTGWRTLRPGALAWDGRRWHVRAWCEQRQAWRDFVLGRISSAEWPSPASGELPADHEWDLWETVQLRINPRLGEQARAALQMDYGLAGETLELQVRKAMKGYLLAELFIADKDSPDQPPHFVMEK